MYDKRYYAQATSLLNDDSLPYGSLIRDGRAWEAATLAYKRYEHAQKNNEPGSDTYFALYEMLCAIERINSRGGQEHLRSNELYYKTFIPYIEHWLTSIQLEQI